MPKCEKLPPVFRFITINFGYFLTFNWSSFDKKETKLRYKTLRKYQKIPTETQSGTNTTTYRHVTQSDMDILNQTPSPLVISKQKYA